MKKQTNLEKEKKWLLVWSGLKKALILPKKGQRTCKEEFYLHCETNKWKDPLIKKKKKHWNVPISILSNYSLTSYSISLDKHKMGIYADNSLKAIKDFKTK